MASGASNSAITGPRNYAFMPTGPTQAVALAATSVTVTLSNFITTLPPCSEVAFTSIGTAGDTSFVVFSGNNTITASVNTFGMPVVTLLGGAKTNFGGMQILRSGVRPEGYLAIGSAGTCTVWITPGQGSR